MRYGLAIHRKKESGPKASKIYEEAESIDPELIISVSKCGDKSVPLWWLSYNRYEEQAQLIAKKLEEFGTQILYLRVPSPGEDVVLTDVITFCDFLTKYRHSFLWIRIIAPDHDFLAENSVCRMLYDRFAALQQLDEEIEISIAPMFPLAIESTYLDNTIKDLLKVYKDTWLEPIFIVNEKMGIKSMIKAAENMVEKNASTMIFWSWSEAAQEVGEYIREHQPVTDSDIFTNFEKPKIKISNKTHGNFKYVIGSKDIPKRGAPILSAKITTWVKAGTTVDVDEITRFGHSLDFAKLTEGGYICIRSGAINYATLMVE
jgi:hypothetical protein